MNFSLNLIPKFEQIINYDIQVMGLLAEIADDLHDHALRVIINSIIGEENDHVRFFTLLLSLAGNDNTLPTSGFGQCPKANETLYTDLIGINPLPSAGFSALKGKHSQNLTDDPETEDKSMNRIPLNCEDAGTKGQEVILQKQKKLVWTFGRC